MKTTSDYVATRVRRAAGQLPYLARALRLVWDAAPGWTALWLGLLAAQGLLPALTVYLTRPLVNSLVAVINTGGAPAALRAAIILAVLMGLLMLFTQILGSVSGWVRTAQSELVADHVMALVHAQSVRLDMAFYDSPEYYDHLHRARNQAGYRPVTLMESLGGIVQNAITLVAMAAVLLPYGAWLPVALLVSTAPALFVVLRYRVREHEWNMRVTADERRTWYYDWLLTARETAAEIRLFGLGDRFQGAYRDIRRRLRLERLELNRDEGFARLAAGVLALVVTAVVMAWMLWQAVQGQANLGDLALFYSAFSQGQGLLRALLENLGQLYSSMLFLGDLFEFLELEPRVVDGRTSGGVEEQRSRGAEGQGRGGITPPVQTGGADGQGRGGETAPLRFVADMMACGLAPSIHFRDITFRYGNSGRKVLEGLDLVVPGGQVAAIVGPNGTGKSTLIKLLCRFYDPLAGSVEVDGVDVRDLPQEVLRRQITVLFQEPVQYSAPVRDNIAITADAGQADVEAAAYAAGADGPIARLPQGYDTLLGTWFEGGTDLSLGEWQRIALARAFLRQAPIVVLDEPTSAMDSWAEADWLTRFRALVAGRTAIIITHRFTTARYADVIHVLDAGRVVESGTHEELVARGGLYAGSWGAQVGTG